MRADWGRLNPAIAGQGLRGFANSGGVDAALGIEKQFAQQSVWLFIREICAFRLNQAFQFLGNGFISDHSLFGGANCGAIKGLAGDNIPGRFFQIRAAVHIHRHIAGTDAVGWFADRMGGFDHSAAAGCQDQAHTLVLHQFLSTLQ